MSELTIDLPAELHNIVRISNRKSISIYPFILKTGPNCKHHWRPTQFMARVCSRCGTAKAVGGRFHKIQSARAKRATAKIHAFEMDGVGYDLTDPEQRLALSRRYMGGGLT